MFPIITPISPHMTGFDMKMRVAGAELWPIVISEARRAGIELKKEDRHTFNMQVIPALSNLSITIERHLRELKTMPDRPRWPSAAVIEAQERAFEIIKQFGGTELANALLTRFLELQGDHD